MTTAAVQFDQAIADLIAALTPFLPPPGGGPPTPPLASITVVSATDASIGVGRVGGTGPPYAGGGFVAADILGGRVDGTVRFELWESTPSLLNQTTLGLQHALRAAADALRVAGFLRLRVSNTSSAELTAGVGWRQSVDYAVLYEYTYADTEADSVIAKIPVEIPPPLGESMTFTDEMVRWDNEQAPMLVARGPMTIGAVTMLAFLPPPAPIGTVVLRRTFDGAGAPVAFPTLAAFIAATGGPTPAERNASVTFASVAALVAALTPAGAPLVMGDWNNDNVPDVYDALQAGLAPAIVLPAWSDRLELEYEHPALTTVGVCYLRATTGAL